MNFDNAGQFLKADSQTPSGANSACRVRSPDQRHAHSVHRTALTKSAGRQENVGDNTYVYLVTNLNLDRRLLLGFPIHRCG